MVKVSFEQYTYLCICVSIYLPANLSTYLCIYLPIYPSGQLLGGGDNIAEIVTEQKAAK